MINIDDTLKVFLDGMGNNFDILSYVYNKKENFIPGVSPVYYSGPYWDQREIIAAIKTILTGKWVSSGENVYHFEKEFAKKFNQNYALMLNSGSSANLVMLAALKQYFGWEDNDEIIVSVVGFPTTIAPIVQNNLEPIFIDIEMDTLNFNVDLIEEKITDKTRAIFISPVLGNPPDFDRLMEICNKYNLQLILDNCDSLGSKWNKKYLNEYAIASSYSFYPAHHITTGEGGMITSNNEEIVKLARSISWWGRECHLKDTKIFTYNGIKNIQDINIGDFVYDHLGELNRVYDILKRNYNDDIYNFSLKRIGDISSTKNHLFLINRDDVIYWEFAKNIKVGDYLVKKIPQVKKLPQTFKYKYQTLIDEKEIEIKKEPDLFRLIGYWIAEGSLSCGNKGSNGRYKKKNNYKYYRVDFCFNSNNIAHINDTILLMKEYFNVTVTKRIKYGGTILSFKTRKGYEFFNQYFGIHATQKTIPFSFIYENNENTKELIKGWWRGDGNKDFQSFSVSTASIDLFEKMDFILTKHGISSSKQIRTPDKHTPSIVNGKKINAKNNLYTLKMYGDNAYNFSLLVNEYYEKKKGHKHTEYFDSKNQFALYEIIDIKIEKKNVDIYNLEVENNHSYHANGIVSHNCFCVGPANLLSNGTCGHRFDSWLAPEYDGIIDHKYYFTQMGYNLKPLDLQGAIGLVQLSKFDEIEERRKNSKEILTDIFQKNIDCLASVDVEKKADVSWFGTPLVCQDKKSKDRLVDYLEKNKIQTRNYFAGNILIHPAYRHLGDYKKYPNANEVLDRVLFIGASPHYNQDVFDHIERIMKEYRYEK